MLCGEVDNETPFLFQYFENLRPWNKKGTAHTKVPFLFLGLGLCTFLKELVCTAFVFSII